MAATNSDALLQLLADVQRQKTEAQERHAAEIAAKDAEPYRGSDVLKLPVYSSPSRENHFVDISIPVSRADEQDKWVLAGVALFLSSS